jgi:hypothetical protein
MDACVQYMDYILSHNADHHVQIYYHKFHIYISNTIIEFQFFLVETNHKYHI